MRIFLCFLSVLISSSLFAQKDIQSFLNAFQTKDKNEGSFLTVYKNENQILCEIPDSIFHRSLSITTTILEGSALKDREWIDKKFGLAGDNFGPIILEFWRSDSTIHLMEQVDNRMIQDSTSSISKIALLRDNYAFHSSFKILARSQNSYLIDATNLFLSFPFFNLTPYSFYLDLGEETTSLKDLYHLSGNAQSCLWEINRRYTLNNDSKRGYKDIPTKIVWKQGVCIHLLPYNPFQITQKNQNIGYFSINQELIDNDLFSTSKMSGIKKWRMEPKPQDLDRYLKGELVEPKQPLVFYIDRGIPKNWQEVFINAVNVWQPAFEKAGFKNAISAKLAPTVEEDATFKSYDASHQYIVLRPSPQSNAYGPSLCDPRTGEILSSHVSIFSSVTDIIQGWYFAQCGTVDPRALDLIYSDSLINDLLTLLVTHEIGHTLGLEHNFYASSNYTTNQLRENAFLKSYSISPSIMDYNRFNYLARKEDHIENQNLISKIGPYDTFAIEWAYRYLPHQDLFEKKLNDWSQNIQNAQPYTRFVGTKDDRSQAEDLSSNYMEASEKGIQNLKELLSNKNYWIPQNKCAYSILSDRWNALIEHFTNYMGHVQNHIGGIQYEYFDNNTPSVYSESINTQEQCIHFIANRINDFSWLLNSSLCQTFDKNREEILQKMTKRIADDLIDRFDKIKKAQAIPSLDGNHSMNIQDYENSILRNFFSNLTSIDSDQKVFIKNYLLKINEKLHEFPNTDLDIFYELLQHKKHILELLKTTEIQTESVHSIYTELISILESDF